MTMESILYIQIIIAILGLAITFLLAQRLFHCPLSRRRFHALALQLSHYNLLLDNDDGAVIEMLAITDEMIHTGVPRNMAIIERSTVRSVHSDSDYVWYYPTEHKLGMQQAEQGNLSTLKYLLLTYQHKKSDTNMEKRIKKSITLMISNIVRKTKV